MNIHVHFICLRSAVKTDLEVSIAMSHLQIGCRSESKKRGGGRNYSGKHYHAYTILD